jgi:hypothetical protein
MPVGHQPSLLCCLPRRFAYVQAKGLRVTPKPGQRLGPHERTIEAVAAIRHPGAEYMAEELKKLKRRRINADYHLEYKRARQHMPRVIRDAERVIAWIDGLP